MAPRRQRPADVDFAQCPFLVLWEVTQACDLACLHCRATAQPARHPLELSTAEGFQLIEQIREFGQPLLVLTGGDPLKRPDLFELIRYGVDRGLRVTLTSSGTPLLTRTAVRQLQKAGLARLAISLDGSAAAIHDRFRGVEGSFVWTLNGIHYAHEAGLPVQVNTTVTRHNVHDLEALSQLLRGLGIVLWSVFFLVPTGRGRAEDDLSPVEYEAVLHWLYDCARSAPFDIKTTAAPQYRRVVLQRRRAEKPPPRQFMGADRVGRAAPGVNDGKGVCFISHQGEVYPSGFLPLSAGNVRRDSLVDIYRYSPFFQALRDPDRLTGKCGRCEYRKICGGSRARAYAYNGDYLAADPACLYEPSVTAKPTASKKPAQEGVSGKGRGRRRGVADDHLSV
jgi:radical SAM protein